MFYTGGGFKEYVTEKIATRLNADIDRVQVDFDFGDIDGLVITVRQYYMTDLSNTRYNEYHFDTLAGFEEWINDEV